MSTILPVLPRLPRKSRANVNRPCLCGCGTPCGKRFAPGHDAKLLAWVLRVEAGLTKIDEIAVHAHAVAVEIHLRASAGLVGSHTPALITREVMASLVAGEVAA